MGIAKAWRYSTFSAKLALEQQHKHVCWRSQKRPISWSIICGLMLFCLGLISLFTGHVASDLEWYSQRLVKRSLYSKLVIFIFTFQPFENSLLSLSLSLSSLSPQSFGVKCCCFYAIGFGLEFGSIGLKRLFLYLYGCDRLFVVSLFYHCP